MITIRRSVFLAVCGAVILMLLTLTVGAQPQAKEKGKEKEEGKAPEEQNAMFKAFDKNGDGRISPDEFKPGEEKFKELDANADKFLSPEEMKKFGPSVERQPRPPVEMGPPDARRFDTGAMQERMLSRMKENLKATDEEWKKIEQPMKNLLDVRMKGSMMGRGRREGPSPETPSEFDALRKALDSEKPDPADVKAKLQAFRDSRKKNEEEQKKAQEELRKVLNVNQEARLVMMGYLE